METSLLFMIAAAVCLFISARGLVLLTVQSYRHACIILAARDLNPTLKSLALLRLQNGVVCFEPIASLLMRSSRMSSLLDKAQDVALHKGIKVTAKSLLTLALALQIVVWAVVLFLTRSIIASFAVIACLAVAVVVSIGSAFDRLQNEFREDIPVVLELMTTCFSSGFTLLQTFQQIAHDMQGQLGSIFSQGAQVLETGGSVAEALGLLRKRTDVSELAFVVAALEVQHQNGGALAPVLSSASESVKGELALKQTLRVQTAQAKFSARVVIVMPFVLIALFSLISPHFMDPFFSSIAGYALLALALFMEAAGIVLVRRSLTIGGLS